MWNLKKIFNAKSTVYNDSIYVYKYNGLFLRSTNKWRQVSPILKPWILVGGFSKNQFGIKWGNLAGR